MAAVVVAVSQPKLLSKWLSTKWIHSLLFFTSFVASVSRL